MSNKISVFKKLSILVITLVSLVAIVLSYNQGRKSGLKDGFINGQIKLLNLLSNETGAFPKNATTEDYNLVYGTKTFSVFVHKDEDYRHIIVTGQY